jgi:capsular exopolysaccharide synthesis family protein
MNSREDFQPSIPNRNSQPEGSFSAPAIGLPSGDEGRFDGAKAIALLRRRWLLFAGVGILVASGLTANTFREIPIYQSGFQLLVGPITGGDKFDELNQSLSKINGGGASERMDYSTQIKVLSSPQLMGQIIEKIQEKYPEVNYGNLLSKLIIVRIGDTKILEVRYQDSDPEKVKFILDQISSDYIKYSAREQQTSVKQGIQFVEDQLPKLRDRVDKLQGKLQQFRQEYKLLDPQTQGQLLSTRLNDINKQRQDTQTQLSEARSLYSNLQRQLGLSPEEAMTASALSEAPRYQQLLSKLQEVETKIAIESARFLPDNPSLKTLQEQRQNLLPLLREEAQQVIGSRTADSNINPQSTSPNSIRVALTQQLVQTESQLQILQIRNAAISQFEGLLNQDIKQLPIVARQYTDLQRELQVATDSLTRFLAVQEALQIESARNTLPWQQISEPQKPGIPISPNIPRGVIVSIVSGLLAGAAAAFLADKLDNVFHSTEELKDSTKLPVLGMIPFNKQLTHKQPQTQNVEANQTNYLLNQSNYTASPFLESFRGLHANLYFLSPDRPIRSLVVTSSLPADGKSTVATYLAQAAAAMGQRVLLVDADLRRPQIHILTDLPNVWGLSNAISSDMNVDDLIQHSPVEDSLFVITAGQIPPDPTRLLSSQKMQSLVEGFHSNFDLVIFDTPPMIGLADARLLAARADGMFVVVGLGRTNRSALAQVLDELRISRAPILGIVANGVKNYTTNSYHYYYQYSSYKRQQNQTTS